MLPFLILALFTTAIKINDLCLDCTVLPHAVGDNGDDRKDLKLFAEWIFFEQNSVSGNAVGKRRKL